MTNTSIPLPLAPEKSLLEVISVRGNIEMVKRLSSMGIMTSNKIQIIQHADDNLIIGIGNSRLAIAQSLAQRVLVTIVTDSKKA